jgi:hypothetical protein
MRAGALALGSMAPALHRSDDHDKGAIAAAATRPRMRALSAPGGPCAHVQGVPGPCLVPCLLRRVCAPLLGALATCACFVRRS